MRLPQHEWTIETHGPEAAEEARALLQIAAPQPSLGASGWVNQLVTQEHPSLQGALESVALQHARELLGRQAQRLIKVRALSEQDLSCGCQVGPGCNRDLPAHVAWLFRWDHPRPGHASRLERKLRGSLQSRIEGDMESQRLLALIAAELCPAMRRAINERGTVALRTAQILANARGELPLHRAELKFDRGDVHRLLDGMLTQEEPENAFITAP